MRPTQTSRRAFIKTAGASIGLGALASQSASAHAQPNIFKVEATGGGFGAYEFTVTGDVTQLGRNADMVEGNRVRGHLGPKRGTDKFRYTGSLDGVTVVGKAKATARINGNWTTIDSTQYPKPSNAYDVGDFTSQSGRNVIKIKGGGGAPSVYEFTLGSGTLRQLNSGDEIQTDDLRAIGHVGRLRGTDTFEYWGELEAFQFVGPGTVFHNGSKVDPTANQQQQQDQQERAQELGQVEFADCYTVSVSGNWKHVGMHVVYPTWAEYETWGAVNGVRKFSTPVDTSGKARGIAARVDLYDSDEGYQNQNPAVQVKNPHKDKCMEKHFPS